MKIFISWSGKKSHKIAEYLAIWIRKVIQKSNIWISSDIDKGKRWNNEIGTELELTDFGIICLTKNNINSNWILFEAGALSKSKDAQICTFLLDIEPKDINPPLSQFQHTIFDKEDIRKLIHTINNRNISKIPKNDLDDTFDLFYPQLENRINEIKEQKYLNPTIKKDRDLINEILLTTRSTQKIILSKETKSDFKGVVIIEGTDSIGIVSRITKIFFGLDKINLNSISMESMDGKFYAEVDISTSYEAFEKAFIELNKFDEINSITIKDKKL